LIDLTPQNDWYEVDVPAGHDTAGLFAFHPQLVE